MSKKAVQEMDNLSGTKGDAFKGIHTLHLVMPLYFYLSYVQLHCFYGYLKKNKVVPTTVFSDSATGINSPYKNSASLSTSQCFNLKPHSK